jgi:hypothetical protein
LELPDRWAALRGLDVAVRVGARSVAEESLVERGDDPVFGDVPEPEQELEGVLARAPRLALAEVLPLELDTA